MPLSHRVCDILRELAAARVSDFVFPGTKAMRPLSGMAMEMLVRRMGVRVFTVHGFRSSFKDWAAECTTIANEISEAALAHVTGDKVERAYRRTDALERRRELMEAWARFIEGENASNVIPLHHTTRRG